MLNNVRNFCLLLNSQDFIIKILKQKLVIKISLNDQKSRAKAMKTVACVDGVIQAALQPDKNQIVVIGDGIDAVLLASLLRKRLKHAEIVSVIPVDDKEEAAKKKELEAAQKLIRPYIIPVTDYFPAPDTGYVSYFHPYMDTSCSI